MYDWQIGELTLQIGGWQNTTHFKKNKRPEEDSARLELFHLKEFNISS